MNSQLARCAVTGGRGSTDACAWGSAQGERLCAQLRLPSGLEAVSRRDNGHPLETCPGFEGAPPVRARWRGGLSLGAAKIPEELGGTCGVRKMVGLVERAQEAKGSGSHSTNGDNLCKKINNNRTG